MFKLSFTAFAPDSLAYSQGSTSPTAPQKNKHIKNINTLMYIRPPHVLWLQVNVPVLRSRWCRLVVFILKGTDAASVQ